MPSAERDAATGWSPIQLGHLLADGAVRRTMLSGLDLVVWRSFEGQVSLWDNRCPHRGMRLSHGFVRGDALACIYHGWHFGKTGVCRSIPAHPGLEPPDAISVNTYRCVEMDGVIWGAEADAAGDPPAISGRGLRSLVVEAPLATAKAAIMAAGGADRTTHLILPVAEAGELILLGQPMTDARSALHLLSVDAVSAGASKALSRAGEAVRRAAEQASASERGAS
ncbi:Rieske 2Fe-2S domain-containing protein [Oricola sp.]|uniref:Rieske 2Fe-2S domain-containing protein n=1 Tax=Oricola sp. TaxID=1979950 RepID=UPI003BA859BD